MDRRAARGSRERPPEELADELSERRSRALEEPLDLRLRQREPYPVIEVRNPLHQTAYLVLRPGFPDLTPALCTCTDFARRGLGTCKHIEAANRWLANHPNAAPTPAPKPAPPVSPLWTEIDRRVERSSDPARPMSLRVRYAGAALFDGGAAKA